MEFPRQRYVEKLVRWRDKHVIKVITGVRRSGKSTVLNLYQRRLLESGVPQERIVAVNFEAFENRKLRDPEALHAYISKRLSPKQTTYIFLDEVQNVRGFEEVVGSLYAKKRTDVYITGSNAFFLSGELATLLAGRYVTIEVLPLSFAEYVDACGGRGDVSRTFRDYVEYGAFPYVVAGLSGHAVAVAEYLGGIYSTIVLKDIIARHRFPDPGQLEDVLRFTLDSVGSLISPKRIADTMTSFGRKIDVKTVEKYLDAFVHCFVLYRVGRYDAKGKQRLKTLDKYYAVDTGLRKRTLGDGGGIGHTLENIVFLELIRRGWEVSVGKMREHEIDFIVRKGNETRYYQVAATVRDTGVLRRELRPLLALTDHYPKTLLTLDDDPDTYHNGILQTNALDWLLGEGD